MEFLKGLLDLFLHLDEYLAQIISDYGMWTYGILFAVIFVETGLVIMPFLPGDSLLFAAGTFAALGSLNIWALLGLLIVAAFLGDTVNYSIGHYLGDRAYNIKWIKKEYLDKTHAFFEKHGGKANRNLEPAPGLDSSQILPPCFSTTDLEMASPSPVPGTWLALVFPR